MNAKPKGSKLIRADKKLLDTLQYLLVLLTFLAAEVWAGLPKGDSTTGQLADKGDWIGILTHNMDKLGAVLGLILSFTALIWASFMLVSKFQQAQSGKAEWGSVLVFAVATAGALGFCFFLIGKSESIIP